MLDSRMLGNETGLTRIRLQLFANPDLAVTSDDTFTPLRNIFCAADKVKRQNEILEMLLIMHEDKFISFNFLLEVKLLSAVCDILLKSDVSCLIALRLLTILYNEITSPRTLVAIRGLAGYNLAHASKEDC